MLLQRVTGVEATAAKVGLYGPGGSGKSLTTALLMIGIAKTYHGGAPVALQDTEAASDWLFDIFEAERVEFYRIRSRAFADMCTALREAEEAGCCAFGVDSYTHPWDELNKALKVRLGVQRLEQHHRAQIADLWDAWVLQFQTSPLHCFFAGRLANEWDSATDEETGKATFVKVGTKMKSEAGAGYEPNLLIEMESVRVPGADGFVHRAHVLKDRARALNGKVLEFSDIHNYRVGDWKAVFEAFRGHFDVLDIGRKAAPPVIDRERNSGDLFVLPGGPDLVRKQQQRQREIALEELAGNMAAIWPGDSAASKKAKATVLDVLFGTLSMTAVENALLETLEEAVAVLKRLRKVGVDGDVAALVSGARDMVRLEAAQRSSSF